MQILRMQMILFKIRYIVNLHLKMNDASYCSKRQRHTMWLYAKKHYVNLSTHHSSTEADNIIISQSV